MVQLPATAAIEYVAAPGDFFPRDLLPRETFGRGDFCPGVLLSGGLLSGSPLLSGSLLCYVAARRHICFCFMAKSAFWRGFSALAPYTGVGPI